MEFKLSDHAILSLIKTDRIKNLNKNISQSHSNFEQKIFCHNIHNKLISLKICEVKCISQCNHYKTLSRILKERGK